MGQKYHFLKIEKTSSGKHFLTLPGQVIGRTPVISHILVKDIKGKTLLSKTKKSANPGEIYFTTTLKRVSHCYTAADIHPLEGNENIFYADAKEEYHKIIHANGSI